VVGALLAATALGGWFYKVPYYALLPGSARDTEGLIHVDGAQVHPSDGEILYTTVRLRGRLSLWEYLWLQHRDDVEVLPEHSVLGDRDQEENRQYNLQLMDNSKQVAVAVALDELGYQVTQPNGVLVVTVVQGSAADGSLQPGDLIVALDGTPVRKAEELVTALAQRHPGDRVTLDVRAHDQADAAAPARQVTIQLGENPDRPGAGFLGIGPTTQVSFQELPFDVAIDTGDVGGPSAGLAFTLAVLDDLTPGDLTGGSNVAVTGTISVDGTVGPVGGVPQKAAAVREAGVRVFLVPQSLGEPVLDEVRERAGPGVQVVPVATVDDAIHALSSIGGDLQGLAAGATPTS
jgi:PDZ domain-containing protein